MKDEQRDAIRLSNQRRNLCCHRCGAMGLKELDGSKVGGMPGITYKVCDSCGTTRAITKRPGRERLR